jgi:hypothetical protein
MEAFVLPMLGGLVYEVYVNSEVVFTNSDKIECYYWANSHNYIIAN